MKGVILAGGKGTRLFPLTKITNKHLLPVYAKPMIFYPLETLRESGIKEILIITSGEFLNQFKKLLGSGKEFGVKLSYKVQSKPDGIAGALALAKEFAKNSPIAVILGDNIFEESFAKDVRDFEKNSSRNSTQAKVFLKKVKDAQRFGVAQIKGKKVVGIEEKPKQPKSRLAVVGMYFFEKIVFDTIKNLNPSKRGELEISDVNNFFIQKNSLIFREIKRFWKDAGTFEALLEASNYLYKKRG